MPAAPQQSATRGMRLRVGDNTGRILGEVTGRLESAPWRLGEIGKTQLHLSRRDAKATDEMLRYGNRVLVEFDNGLPAWGGVIDPPQKHEGGAVVATLYSGEQMLTGHWRVTPKELLLSGMTAGAIFERLIEAANTPVGLGIEPGELFAGGPSLDAAFHFMPVLDAIKWLVEQTGYEWDMTPFESGGRIRFKANLYQRRGRLKRGVGLVEGGNVAVLNLDEQGEIVNEWHVAGADLTGEEDGWASGRLETVARDDDSIARYGLRQGSAVYNDIDVPAVLDATAAALLAESKDPYKIFSLRATNGPGYGFAAHDLGDTARLIAPSVGFGGFDGYVRVTSRSFIPGNGSLEIVAEEDRDV